PGRLPSTVARKALAPSVKVTMVESEDSHSRWTVLITSWRGPFTITASVAISATDSVSGQPASWVRCTVIAPVGSSSFVQVARSAQQSSVAKEFKILDRKIMRPRCLVVRERTALSLPLMPARALCEPPSDLGARPLLRRVLKEALPFMARRAGAEPRLQSRDRQHLSERILESQSREPA